MEQVSFTQMADGTAEQYRYLKSVEDAEFATYPDRVLGWLREMDEPGPYLVTRLEHSLQAATRARRAGENDDYVFMTLLHDVGDMIAPANHSQAAAAIIRPYVSDRVHWICLHHGLFQGVYYAHHYGGDPNARDAFRDHRWYDDTVRFCAEYDQASFDPSYDSDPLESFEHLLRSTFARQLVDTL
ncbi:MAG: HD domain-containing protein [Acidimicrobiia bacterium]|nr:HD domain-containing protein [Acidimicrobiia bacterium]MDH5505440.1 HD domain-containing protein [Acidimicrobiia bacterium]